MKATGIVRRIDDLGRVVIPKEIRRTLRIREGDPLEIFLDNSGNKPMVCFQKYAVFDFEDKAAQMISNMLRAMNLTYAIFSTIERVGGNWQSKYPNRTPTPPEFDDFRRAEYSKELGATIAPILCDGDVYGWILVKGDPEQGVNEFAILAANMMGKYLSD